MRGCDRQAAPAPEIAADAGAVRRAARAPPRPRSTPVVVDDARRPLAPLPTLELFATAQEAPGQAIKTEAVVARSPSEKTMER